MKPLHVEPDLKYLKDLVAAGQRPVDIWASAVDQDLNLIRVHLESGQKLEFVIRKKGAEFITHYKEAIEFCGFGPKGLSNLIYAEALEFGRTHGLKNEQIEVQISAECAKRVGKEIEHYLSYKLTFSVNPSTPGLSYTFKQK